MKVLVLGGGGREHTLVWKIAQSELVEKVYCIPGNAGIAKSAMCKEVDLEPTFQPLVGLVLEAKIDLVVVGPEAPLARGVVNVFGPWWLKETFGTPPKVFGPSQKAAQIESSKIFSKELMWLNAIPTPYARVFYNPGPAMDYINKVGAPIVVKADGLAAGKGSIVCKTVEDALNAVKLMMLDKQFGDAGKGILVEEFLEGEEVSFIAFTDGKNVLPMDTSQDHKPIYEGGPNTGGMGAYSPVPVVTPELQQEIMDTIMKPAVMAMAAEGNPYKGVLYAGLMIIDGRPKVLEFNARMGDPETQAVLPRMKSDIVPIMLACIDGTLDKMQIEWTDEPAVCVVMASGGYPGSYEKGKVIRGLKAADMMEDVIVFHAGTAMKDHDIVTNGGRVLGVTALGTDIKNAKDRAYEAVGRISWPGAYYRRDIGYRALARL